MHRIDPHFKLEWSEDTPLQQALNCVIQQITLLERERVSKLSSPMQDSLKIPSFEQEDLKSRIETLSLEESACKKERSILTSEKEKIKKLKNRYLKLESDFKQRKSEKLSKEEEENSSIDSIKNKLELELQSIADQKLKIDRDTSELERLQQKLEDFNLEVSSKKDSLEQEKAKLFGKTLEIEKEKWLIENLKAQLTEKISINSHLREKIDQEVKDLEAEKTSLLKSRIEQQTENLRQGDSFKTIEEERLAFQSAKLELAEERERLSIEKEKFSHLLAEYEENQRRLLQEKSRVDKEKNSLKEQRLAVDLDWDQIEAKQGSQTGGKKLNTEDPELFEELQRQMEKYYKEIEKREQNLDTKTLELNQREAEVERKLVEMQNVEFSLMRAKQDLEELSLGTIPELENQSQNIQNILAELLQKRHEVDQGYSQLMAQKREFERNKNKSRSANDIARMADELETRIKRIRVKEEELANLEENIVKEKKDNLAKALMLQKAQKEFDESHDKKQTEIEAAAKKLEKLQVKLESAISLMNAKETELIGIKELMIEGKEKNMSSQLSK
jgi:hypothetical protein